MQFIECAVNDGYSYCYQASKTTVLILIGRKNQHLASMVGNLDYTEGK